MARNEQRKTDHSEEHLPGELCGEIDDHTRAREWRPPQAQNSGRDEFSMRRSALILWWRSPL